MENIVGLISIPILLVPVYVYLQTDTGVDIVDAFWKIKAAINTNYGK